jgi:hypothetical protein
MEVEHGCQYGCHLDFLQKIVVFFPFTVSVRLVRPQISASFYAVLYQEIHFSL